MNKCICHNRDDVIEYKAKTLIIAYVDTSLLDREVEARRSRVLCWRIG